MQKLVADRYFVAALLVAPVFWLLLYVFDAPQLSIVWVMTAPWLFLSLVLLQPVLEECVFRGLLQSYLIQRDWGSRCVVGLSVANIVTSVVFVCMHLFYHVPLMALMVIVPALIFGYFRDRYDGWLVPSMLLHCFYNLGYFLLYPPFNQGL